VYQQRCLSLKHVASVNNMFKPKTMCVPDDSNYLWNQTESGCRPFGTFLFHILVDLIFSFTLCHLMLSKSKKCSSCMSNCDCLNQPKCKGVCRNPSRCFCVIIMLKKMCVKCQYNTSLHSARVVAKVLLCSFLIISNLFLT